MGSHANPIVAKLWKEQCLEDRISMIAASEYVEVHLCSGVLSQTIDYSQLPGGIQGPPLVLQNGLPGGSQPGGHTQHSHAHCQRLQVYLQRALLA